MGTSVWMPGVRAFACAGLLACATPEQPPRQDSTVITVEPPAEAPVAPAVVENRLGRMQLLNEPGGGRCTVEGDPQVARRYTYEGEYPVRVVKVEVGDGGRSFAPQMLEVSMRQNRSGYDETETIYVLFTPAGGIERGQRRYFTTETPPLRQDGALLASDSLNARQLAASMLQYCRARAR